MELILSTYFLHKVSLPEWIEKVETYEDLIERVRDNICDSCLYGHEEHSRVVDVEYNGVLYKCRDLNTLLSTPCGLEFEVTEKR